MNQTLPINEDNKIIKQFLNESSKVQRLMKEENMLGSPWLDHTNYSQEKLNTTQSSADSISYRNTHILSKIISENNYSK